MITVVTGPPCSGKSTHIEKNANPGDVVIDMDKIALALVFGIKSFEYGDKIRKIARAARAAAVKEALSVAQGERYFGVWIIHTDPSPDQRSFYRLNGAHFVEMNPGKDVCLERLKLRPQINQSMAREVIDRYYAKR